MFKFHGKVFEGSIKNARTDRYNLMCYIISNDKQQPIYVSDEIIGGRRPIPNNSTTESLEALGDTLNIIYCWIQLFHHSYGVGCKK